MIFAKPKDLEEAVYTLESLLEFDFIQKRYPNEVKKIDNAIKFVKK